MTTFGVSMKQLKITEEAHTRLKTLAAVSGVSMSEVLEYLLCPSSLREESYQGLIAAIRRLDWSSDEAGR